MNRAIFERYSRIINFLFWGVLFCVYFLFMMSLTELPLSDILIGSLIMVTAAGLGIFVHVKYFIPLLERGQWLGYGVGLLLIISFLLGVDFILGNFEGGTEASKMDTPVKFLAALIFYVFILAAGSIIQVLGKKMTESIEHQIELSNEKLTAELNFLKAQINPHFLFNTLNNIYSYAYTQHPETPAMIKKLSSILRYVVYDCKLERTLLKNEVENMGHLFSLYQMKNDEQDGLVFQKPDNCNGGLQIAPLILINLLENAFKHSDALSNKKGFIHAKTEVNEKDVLHFEISNSVKKNSVKNKAYGVGQSNIKKQLDLLYHNKYDLQTVLKDRVFNLKLRLQLDRKDG